jgi:SAM-dependent methyltransferase
MMMALGKLTRAWSVLRLREFGFARGVCPLCAGGWQLRLADNEIGVRCAGCGASAVTQSLVDVLRGLRLALRDCDAYELSARGVLVGWLERACRTLTTSEYLPDVAAGSEVAGVRCENVEALSFADASFDLVTSTEVFEHVADDGAGFAEVRRVLRPGGAFVFTVPLAGSSTVVRVERHGNALHHRLPAEWHGDPRLPGGRALAWRNYGEDIIGRLITAGFDRAWLALPPTVRWFGHARRVVVARA